jgi:predicted P-loop ATPase
MGYDDKNQLKDELKRSITAKQLAEYIAQKEGKPITKHNTNWSCVYVGDGTRIDQKDGCALVEGFSGHVPGGDVFTVVAHYNNLDPQKDFNKVLPLVCDEFGVNTTTTTTPHNQSNTKDSQKETDKQRTKAKAIYDEFMARNWDKLRADLECVECQELFKARGLDPYKIEICKDVGFARTKTLIYGSYYIPANSLVFCDGKQIKAIPFYPDGEKIGHRIRRKDGIKRDGEIINDVYQITGAGGSCHWMPLELKDGCDLYFTEGETSAMALIFSGFDAIPLKHDGDGATIAMELAKQGHRIILAYDNDQKGQEQTQKMMQLLPESINISGLWSGEGWKEGADPNDFVASKSGEPIRDIIASKIERQLTEKEKAKETETPLVLVNDNQKLKIAINAMLSCRKPVLQKDGSTKLEFERGDIAPICAFLKVRGVYKELFTLDNGLRTANGDELTGEILTGEQLIMQSYGLPAMGVCAPRLCMQAARYVCEQNQKDSLRQFVEELPVWDGVDRISEFWQTYAGAIANEETERQYLKSVARYMFTAIIGRALATREKPCKADMAIILEGSTGIGKTSLVKALCARKDWYKTLSLDLPEDEYKRALRMTQFVEIGEMGEPNNKQLQAIKRILSSELLSMRKKGVDDFFYFPVRAFTIATIDQTDVLNDGAGARRWLPVRANGVVRDEKDGHLYIDCDGIKRDLRQLYAQGKAIYEECGVVWNEINKDVQKMHTDSLTVTDARATTILNWMRTQKKTSAKLEEIALDCIGYTRERFGMKEQKELARSLTLSGFVKKVMWLDGKTEKRWTHPDIENINDSKDDEYF